MSMMMILKAMMMSMMNPIKLSGTAFVFYVNRQKINYNMCSSLVLHPDSNLGGNISSLVSVLYLLFFLFSNEAISILASSCACLG